MASLFRQKTEAELAQEQATRDVAQREKAEAAFRKSPQGQADSAFQRGDEFFQIELPHSSVTGFTNAAFNSATAGKIRSRGNRTDLLGQIESQGWRLQHASWVYIQTGQNSRDKFLASGQHVVVTGEVVGIYLFRRDDANRAEPASETAPIESQKTVVSCSHCGAQQRIPTTASRFTCGRCKVVSEAH